MSDIVETVDSRTAALAGRLAFLGTGTSGNAQILIFGTARPGSPSDTPGDAPMVTIMLQNPVGTVEAGAMTLVQVEPGLIMAGGTPTWARAVSRAGITAFDMNVALAGDEESDATCRLSTLALFPGGLVSLVSAVLG